MKCRVYAATYPVHFSIRPRADNGVATTENHVRNKFLFPLSLLYYCLCYLFYQQQLSRFVRKHFDAEPLN